jgi:uncharacterized membrane protein
MNALLIGIALIVIGVGIMALIIFYERDEKKEEVKSTRTTNLFFLLAAIISLDTSLIILPLGLIFLGIIIIIYH